MKRVLYLFLVFSIISINNSFAQEEEKMKKPGWLVVSQNMVSPGDVEKLNKQIDSLTLPIMQELVDEGFLMGWGQFNHAWGDEWNLNMYYVAESQEAFFKAWNEFVKRVSERHPDSYNSWASLLKAHKDNMYFVRHMISGM